MTTVTREEMRDKYPPPAPATVEEIAAIWRLVKIARHDTGQSRRVAAFLLAWCNATDCGGFDLTDLWAVDRTIADDMLTVAGLIGRIHEYPPAIDPDLDREFRAIVAEWRPHLVADEGQHGT